MSTGLRLAYRDDILVVALESDDGFPRLERRILSELEARITNLAAEPELRGAVITGTDRAFAAGAEIAEIASLTPVAAFEFSRRGQSVMRAIGDSPKPVIAAIHGYCMGGGLDLALACHARIASPEAVFAHPGGSLGIITGWGGTQRLPRLIGRSRALDMLVTGRRLDAEEALAWSLIQKIVPTTAADSVVIEAIRQIRTMPARADSTRE